MQQMPFNILIKLPDGTYDYKGATASLFHWIAVKLGRPYDAPISVIPLLTFFVRMHHYKT